jgi:hypothetical protein
MGNEQALEVGGGMEWIGEQAPGAETDQGPHLSLAERDEVRAGGQPLSLELGQPIELTLVAAAGEPEGDLSGPGGDRHDLSLAQDGNRVNTYLRSN